MSSSTKEQFLFPVNVGECQPEPDPNLMGIKGANLSAMANIGLPVPPGFVISSELGKAIAAGEDALGDIHRAAIRNSISHLEQNLDRSFGGKERPLLVSVRSGAAVSMPGMMDTVLNLGLNNQSVLALAKVTNDERFAWDTYRRFIQSFAHVVMDLDADEFEEVLEEMRDDQGVDADAELPASALKEVAEIFLDIVQQQSNAPFPQDAHEQLELALLAVFHSWNTPRAKRYRDMHSIPHDGGTAAIIQAMVFGNRNESSCTGVYFTRNPSTGERLPYGEYMLNAQGEDVVSGIRTPMNLTERDRERAMSDNPSMETVLPEVFQQLLEVGKTLETHFQDMQEIEFTVESERLFLLQTRIAKRTPQAALRIAVDSVGEGLISKEEAVFRCDMAALTPMLVSKIAPPAEAALLTKGLPASPGAAVGQIVFTSDEAVACRQNGKPCILVRPETDPKDVHGMDAADGILTTRGGMTSHAAVVARGMGKPCITAAMTLKIDLANQMCSSAGHILRSGDIISMDGGTGTVFIDEQPVVFPEPEGALAEILAWRNELGG